MPRPDIDTVIAELDEQIAAMEARLPELRAVRADLVRARETLGTVNRPLHNSSQKSTVMNANMTGVHRIAISRGRHDSDWLKAIRSAKPKGYTQNSLASAIGVKPSLLSMYRRKLRKIPQSRADLVQKLTGWPATLKGWPGGIISDEN